MGYRIMRTFASLTLCLLVSSEAAAAPVSGLARAKDGDSMMVGQTEVRLFGVDAPEFDQSCSRSGQAWACGAEAADRLSRLVTGKEVRCTAVSIDQYHRTLGRCTVGTTDINRTVVATGYAVAYRRYSSDYVSAEETAKLNRRGIWAGSFEMPDAYRHEATAVTYGTSVPARRARMPSVGRSPPSAPTGGCFIKGNQGSNGWIYHVPGMPYYAKTRAEQIFCSEADAQAAGYRRAKVR
jgi:endonuclease YncB( thermonuclease family)